jgi:hypothetical protein
MDLDRFKPDHWWNVVAAAGSLIAVAALWQQFLAAFPIGLGLLSFGIGEWINHPPQSEVAQSVVVNIHAKDASGSWKPAILGVILDALGVGLLVFGVIRLLTPSAP